MSPRGAWRWSWVLGLWLGAHGAAAQGSPALEAGRAALDARQYDVAAGHFQRATQSADPGEAALGGFYLAVVADERMDFAAALAGYRAFVAHDPGSRWAARALARIEDLEAHAEGDFVPLVALERVRRDPALARDAAAIAALERAADGFPPGRVRSEARMLVGEAWLDRLNRPRDALRVFLALARDPAAPQGERDLAGERALAARMQLGEETRAESELRHSHAGGGVVDMARTLGRRRRIAYGAEVLLVGLALVGVASVARALRRGQGRALVRVWLRPMQLVQLGMLTLGGALLARRTDDHDPGPFLLLALGALALYLTATAWNLTAPPDASRTARALRAALCALGVLAVAFLAMFTQDPMMLEGIGL